MAIRFAGIMLIPFLAGALLLASAPTVTAQPIEMKFAHYADEKHPAHLAAKQMAAKVEERTKGQVKIASSRTTPWDRRRRCEQVKLGAIDMPSRPRGSSRTTSAPA